jgi:superfamily II DNA/RNA helicase
MSASQGEGSNYNSHSHDARKRTKDVAVAEDITFEQLLLSKPILAGLNAAGFFKPSPIQLQAIPKGKFGSGNIV